MNSNGWCAAVAAGVLALTAEGAFAIVSPQGAINDGQAAMAACNKAKQGAKGVEEGMAFVALPGNHWTGREGEQCVIYSVRTKKSHLLYATDTGGIMAETFSRLSSLPVITAIVMNAMVGPNMRTDRRIFTHSTPELVQETAAALTGVKRYQPPAGRPVWTTHLSYVMHGTQAEVEKAYPKGVVPAKDGLVIEV